MIDYDMKRILGKCGEEVEEVLMNSKTREWKIKTSVVESMNDEESWMPPTKAFKPTTEDTDNTASPLTDISTPGASVGPPGSSIINAIVIE